MSRSSIPVKLQPRTAPCRAVTAWHSDSALLVCSFEFSVEPARVPPTVAGRIDAALGISATPPRALLGDVDLTWQDESRLHSIELRTGRSRWEHSSLSIPSERTEECFMTLGLEYDVNRIANMDVEVRVLWDAAHAGLGLRFGDTLPADGRWVTIADTAFACIDDEQMLIELRFANVQLL